MLVFKNIVTMNSLEKAMKTLIEACHGINLTKMIESSIIRHYSY